MRHLLPALLLLALALHAATDSANVRNEQRLRDFDGGAYPVAVAIGPVSRAPQVDGKIAPDEWDDCAAFTGMRDFHGRQLLPAGLLVRAAYDETHFHGLIIVPNSRPALPTRLPDDMELFRDNGVVELMLLPAAPSDAPVRRLAVSASGSRVDMLGADRSWNSDVRLAIGEAADGAGAPWIARAGLPEKWWFIELSLPLKSLQLNASPGHSWKFNLFWIDNGHFTFAPVERQADETPRFARLDLLDAATPRLALYSLGNPAAGYFNLRGELLNASAGTPVDADLFACKTGTRFQTQTGYDEIVGELETAVVRAAGSLPAIDRWLTRPDCNLADLQLNVGGRTLFRLAAPVKVALPLELQLGDLPGAKQATLTVSSTAATPVQLAVTAPDGRQVLEHQMPPGKFSFDYRAWPDGDYTVTATQGTRKIQQIFSVTPPPAWLNRRLGLSDRVLKPFEPLRLDGHSVSLWNRTYSWNESLLFDYRTGDEPWQNAPVLTVHRNGKATPVRLTGCRVVSASPTAVELHLEGEGGGLNVKGTARLEYDGLAWFELDAVSAEANPIDIEALTLTTCFDPQYATLYHGAPDRSLNGAIPETAATYPWQVYFWVGTPAGGLGFINESRQMYRHVAADETFTLERRDNQVVWQIHLASQTRLDRLRLSFGLQATPVKPLPPHYESMVTENWGRSRRDHFGKLAPNMDFTTVWRNNCNYMPYICDPAGIDFTALKTAVDDAHRDQVMAIPYFAPISFTENVRPEHVRYYDEWVQLPIRRWKSPESVQVRCCVNSSYLEFLLHNLSQVEQQTGADGFYFDGAWPVECSNTAHGCGYLDADGNLQPTHAVRKTREFLRRAATLAAEAMEKRGQRPELRHWGPGFPDYHVWIHISGSVAPPMHSFATALFCGEWFKGPIRSGKGYDTLLTLDQFRPRYLSQPWGIVNFFLAIVNPSLDATFHTDVTLAYLVPAGVGLYPRYLQMEMVMQLLQSKKDFDTVTARFFPPWQIPASLRLQARPDVQTGIWQHADGAMLLAIGNCGPKPETLTLHPDHAQRTARVLMGRGTLTRPGSTVQMQLPPHSLTMLEIR